MALDMTTALTIRAKVDGLQQLSGLQKGLGGVTKQSNAAAGAMGKLRGAAAGALGALRGVLPVLGVGAMAGFAKSNLEAADAMSKMSQRTGVAAPMLDKFRKVAELNDTSIEGLGKGFKTLASNMYDASTRGTGPAAEAFERLGIAITDSNGKLRASDQVMLDVADKFRQMADGPEKAALAADLFGAKIGDELIPLLNNGGDAVRNMSTSLTQDFADKAAALLDRITEINQKFGDLAIRLTEGLVPALEVVASGMEGVGAVFSGLPQPVQDLAAGFAAIAIPVAALAVPLGGLILTFGAIGTALAAIVPVLAGIPALLAGWAGAIGPVVAAIGSLPALLAGWAGAIGPVVAAIGSLGQILIGVFSGPVGWVALAVAAGAAIYAFRDQIGAAFQAIGQFIANAASGFKSTFVDPLIEFGGQVISFFTESWMQLLEILKQPFTEALDFLSANFVEPFLQYGQQVIDWFTNTWATIVEIIRQPFEQAIQFIQENFVAPIQTALQQTVEYIQTSWANLKEVIASPFTAAISIVKSALNGIMAAIEGGINGAVAGINKLIAAANRVPGVKIPLAQKVKLPRFAEGGVVTGPTMALVGEGGEPEYIVPQSKAGAFAANWMAGVRGPAAIPRFAEGGVVVPSANVSIQTGPVTQMNGTNFVTTQDLSRAVQSGVNQTLSMIAGDGRIRRQLGIA